MARRSPPLTPRPSSPGRQTFLYSSSRGCVRLGDMRARALCDQHAKVFEEPDDPANKTFFSEITTSISNARFARDGKYIVTRDYMTVRVWDVAMESRPLKTLSIHEHLRPKLCDLYENDCIFDKFDVCFNHDASWLVTGSYQNTFHLLSREGKQPDVVLEASKTPNRRRASTGGGVGSPRQALQMARNRMASAVGASSSEPLDFSKRILHAAFHPHQARRRRRPRRRRPAPAPAAPRVTRRLPRAQNIIAVAATSTLYIFRV